MNSMEEDIKKIKNMLNIHSSLDLGAKDYTDILDEEERLSIQNLIDRNRYLKTKAAAEINNEINNIKVKIFKNYIPVSLVEETIEELDIKITYIESQYTNGGQNCNSNYLSALYQKQILQKLLEKR